MKEEKPVYFKYCEYYREANYIIPGHCFPVKGTYYAPDDARLQLPTVLNKNNNCEYFKEKSKDENLDKNKRWWQFWVKGDKK